MFTVKLMKGHDIKLIQAEEVNIYSAGPASGRGDEPKSRNNEVREVATILGDRSDAFFIADTRESKPVGFAEHVQFYDSAYIENQHGATTQIVRPY